jgi:cytochrome c-type biogenesis protein CcmE
MSLIAWVAFIVCAIGATLSFIQNRDYRFLMMVIPMLLALLVIPIILSRMSQSVYRGAEVLYDQKAKFRRIKNVTLNSVGESVKIGGVVEKVTFRWLNRPHLLVNDGTGVISVIMFAAPPEEISVGDEVEVVGMVMRRFLIRGEAAISGVSVRRKERERC